MKLTDWMKCSEKPVREGWYDVQRMIQGKAQPTERVRFCGGRWDWAASESKIPVWVFHDYWRGVAKEQA